MTTIALTLAALSLVVALVCFAALIEMHRNLESLQKYVEYDDTPQLIRDTMHLPGTAPSRYGLPEHLDDGSAVLLLLSPKCRTCITLAEKLAKDVPDDLHIVVTGADEMTSRQWLKETGLAVESVILDRDYEIVDRLSLHATPAGVRITDGLFAGAWSIPSYRALQSFLDGEPSSASPNTPNLPQTTDGVDYAKAG